MARRASFSPIAGANLAPCPKQGDATIRRELSQRSIMNSSPLSGRRSAGRVFVYRQMSLSAIGPAAHGTSSARASLTGNNSASVAGGSQSSVLTSGP